MHPWQHSSHMNCPIMTLWSQWDHSPVTAHRSLVLPIYFPCCMHWLVYRHFRESEGAGISRGMQEDFSQAIGNVIFSEESSQDPIGQLRSFSTQFPKKTTFPGPFLMSPSSCVSSRRLTRPGTNVCLECNLKAKWHGNVVVTFNMRPVSL